MDISLVKNLIRIDKIIEINRVEPVSFKQFSIGIVPGCTSAAGFNLKKPIENFSEVDWFIILKFVNASKENIIIKNIQSEWIGKDNYKCKSNDFLTQVYEANGDNEEDVINQLLDTNIKHDEDESFKRRILFLPSLIKRQSEKITRVDFVLETYRRIFFKYWKPISFKREEIKEPETYIQILQKAVIKVKISGKKKPLLIKI